MAIGLQKRTSGESKRNYFYVNLAEDIGHNGKRASSATYRNSKVSQSFTSAAKADFFNSFIAGLRPSKPKSGLPGAPEKACSTLTEIQQLLEAA